MLNMKGKFRKGKVEFALSMFKNLILKIWEFDKNTHNCYYIYECKGA
jgi:hypothetical protein